MKRDELLSEVLAAHADHLNLGGNHTETYLTMFPEDREALAPLLDLAAQLKTVLTPVEASPAFRKQLYFELVQSAGDALQTSSWRSRLSLRPHLPGRFSELPVMFRLPETSGRQALVRAAAGGAGLAAAGVAAYVLHERLSDR